MQPLLNPTQKPMVGFISSTLQCNPQANKEPSTIPSLGMPLIPPPTTSSQPSVASPTI
jgi:hypothetical protein